MRKLFAFLLAVLLLPAALAAQKVPPVKNAPAAALTAKDIPIQQAQALATAVQAVRAELQKGTFAHTWPVKSGARGPIPPASVKGAGALFNPTGGKEGKPIWVVGVSSPIGQGAMRVLVDARTGAVVPGNGAVAAFGAWDWGNSPDWWLKGYDDPVFNKPKQQSTAH